MPWRRAVLEGLCDGGEKFSHYRKLELGTDDILVVQGRVRVEQFTRQKDNGWLLSEVSSLDNAEPIAPIDCKLRLLEVYDRVKLDPLGREI